MTRTEFIQGYAERSGLDASFAGIGLLPVGSKTLVALPCACGEDDCPGWAMLSADSIDSHMRFSAPDELRDTYVKAVDRAR